MLIYKAYKYRIYPDDEQNNAIGTDVWLLSLKRLLSVYADEYLSQCFHTVIMRKGWFLK
ncbi:helix-turn-helix protein [Paenibacillus methanolicus]|uniref:Helix-turn-helix protein n=1 Tax=Paenibacillus methanolicus TaxID=582686 RepID=A0A5S5CDL7_9BACL|nr:helix-turn-helix protein [Paenibacillus methanolicus]